MDASGTKLSRVEAYVEAIRQQWRDRLREEDGGSKTKQKPTIEGHYSLDIKIIMLAKISLIGGHRQIYSKIYLTEINHSVPTP